MPVGDRHKGFWCVRDWNNGTLWKFHELYYLTLVLIGPSSIMTFTYSLICWEIWRLMEKRSVMTSRKAYETQKLLPKLHVILLYFLRLSRNYTVQDSQAEENLQLTDIQKHTHKFKKNDPDSKRLKLVYESAQLNEMQRQKERNCTKDDSKIVKQVIYMLVIVVVLFTICWAPLLIENVLTAYGILPKQRIDKLKHISITFHLMAYFNR